MVQHPVLPLSAVSPDVVLVARTLSKLALNKYKHVQNGAVQCLSTALDRFPPLHDVVAEETLRYMEMAGVSEDGGSGSGSGKEGEMGLV